MAGPISLSADFFAILLSTGLPDHLAFGCGAVLSVGRANKSSLHW